MRSARLIVSSLLCLALLLGLASVLHAQKGRDKEKEKSSGTSSAAPQTKREGNKAKIAVTPEREAAVMTFVRRNHEELAQLLTHLKEDQPKEYERAIRELFRASERLAQIQERDPGQYELELQLWNTQSRIQLLTARLKMGASDDLKTDLEKLLGQQLDLRVELLRLDRRKAEERLARIDADLARLEKQRNQVIKRQLQTLVRAADEGSAEGGRARVPGKNRAKPRAATGAR
jgi:hypothetical protein